MSKPRLIYFDFAGSRGEECRIALHLAGIDFEDVRVKRGDWPAMKADMPFGRLPVLEIPGEVPLAHSNAILVFVGRQHRLHPADAFEAARHEALMCAVEELRDTMTPALRITDPEQKRQAREETQQRPTNARERLMNAQTDMVRQPRCSFHNRAARSEATGGRPQP